MPTLVLRNKLGFTHRYRFTQAGTDTDRKQQELSSTSDQDWSAWLEGDFNSDWTYELSTGFDPDVVYTSSGTNSNGTELSLTNLKDPKRRTLFAQTFGNSYLFLRCRTDRASRTSITLLKILVHIDVPPEKDALYKALCTFYFEKSNGFFRFDSIHGQTFEKVSQRDFRYFQPGYSSFSDHEIELRTIEQLFSDKFRVSLLGIVRHREERFVAHQCWQRLSRIRRVPSRARKFDISTNQDAIVFAPRRLPSVKTPANNAISSFLHTISRRLKAIDSHISNLSSFSEKEIRKAERRSARKNDSTDWILSQTAREASAKDDLHKRCRDLMNIVAQFENIEVFSYAPQREQSIFTLPVGGTPNTPDYIVVLGKIRDYCMTNFYWTGDPCSLFRQPAYIQSSDGRDTWSRKYSMLYEFWCYIRLHETFKEIGFKTSDVPSNGVMSKSVFSNGILKAVLCHDVRTAEDDGDIPLSTRGKTPDFVIFFEHLQSKKCALVILDSKSNGDYANYIPEKRNDYLISCGMHEEQLRRPLLVKQSWILLSGEHCTSFDRKIICPPNETSLDEYSYSDMEEDTYYVGLFKRRFPALQWDGNGFVSTHSGDTTLWHAGYVFSHIPRDDKEDSDNFQLFIENEVRLMEQLLA